MSLILNIETSTEICSVCLGKNGEMVALRETDKPQSHAAELTCMIDEVMKEVGAAYKDLAAVAVSSGPGSYTGLRIGVSTAKGICYAADLPLLEVDTLRSMAIAAMRQEKKEGYYIPMIDARRMEVYTATYAYKKYFPLKKTHARIIDKESYQEYLSEEKNIFLFGNGAKKCMPFFLSPYFQLLKIRCSAAHLVYLSQKVNLFNKKSDLAYYSPSYLKPPKITISKKKL